MILISFFTSQIEKEHDLNHLTTTERNTRGQKSRRRRKSQPWAGLNPTTSRSGGVYSTHALQSNCQRARSQLVNPNTIYEIILYSEIRHWSFRKWFPTSTGRSIVGRFILYVRLTADCYQGV